MASLLFTTVLVPEVHAAGSTKDPVCTQVGQVIVVDGFQYKCYGVLKLPDSQQDTIPTTSKKVPSVKPKPSLPLPKALTPCTKIGEQRTGYNVIFKCAISNRKLLWQSITQHSQKVPDSALYKAPPPLPPQIPVPVLIGNPTKSVAGNPITLSISGGQGNGSVDFSVTGTGCYVAGNQLFSLKAGVCSVIAKKTSDKQYAEAFAEFKSFTFAGQPSPTLAISNNSEISPIGTSIAITTVGGNGNPLIEFKTTSSGCSINGNMLTSTKLTICYVTAVQNQFDKYGLAISPTVGFKFASAQSALVITPASSTVVKGTQINLGTTGGDGNGAVTFKVSGGTCILTGSILTSTDLGSCSVVATKASDEVYQQSYSKYAVYTFVAEPLILQEPLKITNPNSTINTSENVVLNLIGGSGTGAITYTVTGKYCAVSPIGIVTATAPTNCSVSAKKAADKKYQITTSNTIAITFLKPPLINQSPLRINNLNVTVSTGQAIELSLSGGSGSGTITYNVVGNGCNLVGSSIISTIPTNCIISAVKKADVKYLSALSNTVVFTYIAPITPPAPIADVLEIMNSNRNGLVNVPIPLLTNGSRGALVSYTVTAGGCSITGSNLSSTVPEQCSVVAVSRLQGASSNIYSQPATFRFSNPVSELLVTNAISPAPLVGTVITLTSTNGNGNKVTYTTATGSTCLITGDKLTSAKAAACPVEAVQLEADGVKFTSSPTVTFNFTLKPQLPLVVAADSSSAPAGTLVPLKVSGGSTRGAITYQVDGNGCSVVNDSLTASIATSCSVYPTMAGNTEYNSVTAPYIIVNFTKIAQSPLTITNSKTSFEIVDSTTATVDITTRGGSGSAPITLSIVAASSTGECRIDGNVLSSKTGGSCTVVALRGADSTFNAIWSDPVVFTFVKPQK